MAEELKLLPDEEVIKRGGAVGHGRGLKNGELILTNKNLIFLRKNIFGKTKRILTFPLSEIRVANGQVQAKVGKTDFMSCSLDVYFQSGLERFPIAWESDAQDWADSITETITGVPVKKREDAWLEETLALADYAAGVINHFRRALGAKDRLSAPCPGCGASLKGISGETTKCPYCGSYYTF